MTEITQADRSMAAHVWMALDAEQLDTASLQIFFARHREAAFEAGKQEAWGYWYRQGKDDGAQSERERIIDWLRETWRTDMGVIESLDIADAIEAGDHLK